MTAKATQPRTPQQIGQDMDFLATCMSQQLAGVAGLFELMVRTHEADVQLLQRMSRELAKHDELPLCSPYPYRTNQAVESFIDPGLSAATSLVDGVASQINDLSRMADELKGGAK